MSTLHVFPVHVFRNQISTPSHTPMPERLRELALEAKTERWLDVSDVCAATRGDYGMCMLDYLELHQEYIPKECAGKTMFFHGSCKYSNNKPCMRYLTQTTEGRWTWAYWLDEMDATGVPPAH